MRSTFMIAIAMVATFSAADLQEKKDVVRATHTVTGTFKGFEVGDYVHAVIKDSKGKELSYFVAREGIDYFLALNKGKKGTFTYQVVNTFIEEAGGRMDIERLESAKFGKETSEAWWKAIRKKMSIEAIRKKYQPLVEKATLGG